MPLSAATAARSGSSRRVKIGNAAVRAPRATASRAAAVADDQQRIAARKLRVERRAQGAGRETPPLPMPRPAVDHRDREILGAATEFWNPSSITTTLAPAARASAAPATRSRETMVGATRASSSGSSPTSAALMASRVDAPRPAALPP